VIWPSTEYYLGDLAARRLLTDMGMAPAALPGFIIILAIKGGLRYVL